jgi:type I restriction enzyme S subunit
MVRGITVMGRKVESFRVTSELVVGSQELRLDASFYNAEVISALAALDTSGMVAKTIREVTSRVFIPGRFKRNYVDADHGVPFLQGSHMVQFKPDDMKYLSKTTHANMANLLIHEGWVLITRSGTVGRVAIVTSQWDGWAASEHIFRVVPKTGSGCPAGYLAAFLGSPLGQLQLNRQIYGAVVDELTEDHIRSVRVPLPVTVSQKRRVQEIAGLAMKAAAARAAAVELSEQVDDQIVDLLPKVDNVPEETEFEKSATLTPQLLRATSRAKGQR